MLAALARATASVAPVAERRLGQPQGTPAALAAPKIRASDLGVGLTYGYPTLTASTIYLSTITARIRDIHKISHHRTIGRGGAREEKLSRQDKRSSLQGRCHVCHGEWRRFCRDVCLGSGRCVWQSNTTPDIGRIPSMRWRSSNAEPDGRRNAAHSMVTTPGTRMIQEKLGTPRA